jgi:hypothetical protein
MLSRIGLFHLPSVSFLVSMVSGQIPPCQAHQLPKQPTVVPGMRTEKESFMCESFCYVVANISDWEAKECIQNFCEGGGITLTWLYDEYVVKLRQMELAHE